MIILRTTICLALSLLFPAGDLLYAQPSGSTNTARSCQEFVKSFYNSYARRAFTNSRGWLIFSLRDRPSVFHPSLLRVFREYQSAPPNTRAETEKLDFDPFLNAQDTAESYTVENFRRNNDAFLVDVYSVSSGGKHEMPDVTPELVSKNGRWLFVNFHYPNSKTPEGENLVSILMSLRERRSKVPKSQ